MFRLPYIEMVFLVLMLALSFFLICACSISARQPEAKADAALSAEKAAEETPSSVTSAVTSSAQEDVSSPPPDSSPKPPEVKYFKPLYVQNEDIIGWLSIEGTVIDYPVMYTPEAHDFYLSHDFAKKPDKKGLLVLQADCDPYTPGINLIIHGHKMKNGQMFGTLSKYKSKAYWKKHPVIKFDTLYAQGEYSVFAAFFSKVYDVTEDVFKYYHFINAGNEAEFNDFISNIKKLARYETDVGVNYGDKMITLSTCSYHTKDGRFVVVAKKIK